MEEHNYLSGVELHLATKPMFKLQVSADVVLMESEGNLFLDVANMTLAHSPDYPRSDHVIEYTSFSFGYLEPEPFCYISSGKERCRPPGWKYLGKGKPLPVNQVLKADQDELILEDMKLLFSEGGHGLDKTLDTVLIVYVGDSSGFVTLQSKPGRLR